eukprot:3939297-Rhodomonas_salina.2
MPCPVLEASSCYALSGTDPVICYDASSTERVRMWYQTAKHDADNVVAIEMMLAVGQNDSDAEGGTSLPVLCHTKRGTARGDALVLCGTEPSVLSGTERYDQWVDRDYLKFTVPEVDWDLWFNEMNFSGVGVGDDDEEADDEGQVLSSTMRLRACYAMSGTGAAPY